MFPTPVSIATNQNIFAKTSPTAIAVFDDGKEKSVLLARIL